MKLRFLVFAFGTSRIDAQSTVPIGIYPQYLEDCVDTNGAPGNSDLCIQCYSCTYQYQSSGLEGGLNCLEGPWDNTNSPFVFKEYCSSSPYNGINDDFANLECAPEDTRLEVMCTVETNMQSDNEMYQYLLTRGMRSLPSGTDLGIPEFGGFYNIRSEKTGTALCATSDCNAMDVHQEEPVSTRNTINCKSCSYSSDDGPHTACVDDASSVESVTCEENQVCRTFVEQMAQNYDGSNLGLINVTDSITRECAANTMSSTRSETDLQQRRWIVCYGDLCNIMGLDVDPEDASPLPRPGQWDQPLTAVEATIFCGRMLENCIRCHVCNASPASPYAPCVTYPDANPEGAQWYRKRYFDERINDWVNNMCAVEVRHVTTDESALAEIDGTVSVVRYAIQVTDEELPWTTNNPTIDVCRGDLCNGESTNLVDENHNRCFFCAAENSDSTNNCITGAFTESDLTVDCLSGVCDVITGDTITSRGCLVGNPYSDWVTTEPLTYEYSADIHTCSEPMCNDNYVNSNWEILDVQPTFIPAFIPTPIASGTAPTVCNSAMEGDDMDLCMQCYTCNHVVNEDSLPTEYEYCITDLDDTLQYYFKEIDGIPTVCGFKTDRSRSTEGYFYNIVRGAVVNVDPSLTVGMEPSDLLKIVTHRSSHVDCRDSYCNSYPYSELPIPPVTAPRTAREVENRNVEGCFECTADSTQIGSDGETPECFGVPSTTNTCEAETDACFVELTEEWDITRDNMFDIKHTIERGCTKETYSTSVVQAQVTTRDAWVCMGDSCNNQEELDMPPYDAVIIDGSRWSAPLSLEESDQVCTTVPCIECLTCLHIYNANDTYPNDYACSSRSYRASYLDPSNPVHLLYNHCHTRTGLRENGLGDLKRFTRHGAEPTTDMAANTDPSSMIGVTNLDSTTGLCDSCDGGNCFTIGPQVECPSLVCRQYIQGEIMRWKGCATDTETEEFNNGVRTITEQEQWVACDGDRCNAVGQNPYSPAPIVSTDDEITVFPFPDEDYPGIFAEDPNDCYWPQGAPDNQDLCVQCYRCTYTVDSTGLEGGARCNTGPWDPLENPLVFQSYCTPSSEETGYSGINNDFANLECSPDQTRVMVHCSARSQMISDNDYFQYRIDRQMVVLAESLDLGLPEFGGYYNVEDQKEGTAYCNTPDCNDIDIQQPNNMRDGHDNLTCKTCVFTRNTADGAENFGDSNCLESISQVESGNCGEEEVCSLEIVRNSNNFDGSNAGLRMRTETVSRGCRAYSMPSNRPETMLKQRRTVVCGFSGCNNMQLLVDPEDMGPLPRPGQWDQPIDQIQVPLICGPLNQSCKMCHYCYSELGNVFDICRNNAEFTEQVYYRNRYFDDRSGEWLNNVCGITTVTIESEYTDYLTGVARGAIQLTDDQLANGIMEVEYDEDDVMCIGHLCNGEGTTFESETTQCYYCESSDSEDACSTGIFPDGFPTEECSTNVCSVCTTGSLIERGCAHRAEFGLIQQIIDENPGLVNVAARHSGIKQGCTGSNCNTDYVNVDLEILPEPPVYDPMRVPAPVSNVDICNDRTHPGVDTDLCIECYNCQHVVSSYDAEPDYESCITALGENRKSYFFKSENGIPTVCSLRTTKTLSDDGYTYFIERGAIAYFDPTLVNVVGPTKIQTRRQTRFGCADDFCNGYPLGMIPIPPMVGPRRHARQASSPRCFKCNYDENAASGDVSCLMEPTEMTLCEVNEICELDLVEEYVISDAIFQDTDITMNRGCKASNSKPVFEIVSQKLDTWVCAGANCNSEVNEPEMPPYNPLPTDPDRWSEPLSPSMVDTVCGFSECIECLMCNHVYSVDAPYPSDYVCESATYKANFLNARDTSEMYYNLCTVRSGLRENGLTQLRFISHTVWYSKTPELPSTEVMTKLAVTELTASATRAGNCPVCNDMLECSRIVLQMCTSVQEVCRAYREDDVMLSSGCASGEEVVLFNSGVTEITEQIQYSTCNGPLCNEVGFEDSYTPEPIVSTAAPTTTTPATTPTDAPVVTTSSGQSIAISAVLTFLLFLMI